MPRPAPLTQTVDFCGFILKLKLKRNQKEGGTKFKGVHAVNTNVRQYTAYVTRKGKKCYIGTYKEEYDAAVAIAFAEMYGVDNLPSPKAKDGKEKEEFSPLHGITDKEASRLASPPYSQPATAQPTSQKGRKGVISEV